MKKTWLLIILALTIILTACATYSLPPQEFDPLLDGDGIRILLIDDFTGSFSGSVHGDKTGWALYDAYPFANIECIDIENAKLYHWQKGFDLIIVMPWFESERQAKEFIPDRILEADTMKIAPAGNADPPYSGDNALDEWFVLIGANGHPEWQQGEITWNEGELSGTCGATIEFGIALIGEIIDERMEKK